MKCWASVRFFKFRRQIKLTDRCKPTAFAGTGDRMIYASLGATRYKLAMETSSLAPASTRKKSVMAEADARDTFVAQTPLAVIGLAAIGMILLINSHARPTPAHARAAEKIVVVACAECGTVVAVRRTADVELSYVVEVQMLDGSLRMIQQLAGRFNVGDIVQVNGNALTLRSAAS